MKEAMLRMMLCADTDQALFGQIQSSSVSSKTKSIVSIPKQPIHGLPSALACIDVPSIMQLMEVGAVWSGIIYLF